MKKSEIVVIGINFAVATSDLINYYKGNYYY